MVAVNLDSFSSLNRFKIVNGIKPSEKSIKSYSTEEKLLRRVRKYCEELIDTSPKKMQIRLERHQKIAEKVIAKLSSDLLKIQINILDDEELLNSLVSMKRK